MLVSYSTNASNFNEPSCIRGSATSAGCLTSQMAMYGKCLGAKIVAADEGWAPPRVCIDTVVGSGLPKCCYCGQTRPLHFPGDCNWALYESNRMPCLVCGSDSHIPEECPIPGTSVVGCVTLLDMVDAHLMKCQN